MSAETCSVCLENDSKYTCPACEAKTCSLDCVKRHKLRTECSGKVDPTKFVSRKELASQESLVNRDYNYLLNFERKIANGVSDVKESAKKILKRPAAQNKYVKRQRPGDGEEDKRLAAVRKCFPNATDTSIKRENTLIVHLSAGMSRSTLNKSGFDKKTGSFTWTIEWAPLLGNGDPKPSFLSFRIKETSSLKDAVPLAVLAKSLDVDLVEKEDLRFYLENCLDISSSRSFIELNASHSISDALKDSVVLEYPKIFVFRGDEVPEDLQERVKRKENAYGLGELDSESDSDSDLDSSDSSSDDDSSSVEEGPEESSSKPTGAQVPEMNPEIMTNSGE